jgi:hypothetical protein
LIVTVKQDKLLIVTVKQDKLLIVTVKTIWVIDSSCKIR